MAVTIRRLEEFDEVESFDCGDEPLNNYLKRHAWTNQEKVSIGVTYVAVDESAPHTVLGYFTLATSSVPRDRFPKKYVRGLPPYDLPLILLARLAVDKRFSGKGPGPRADLRSSQNYRCAWPTKLAAAASSPTLIPIRQDGMRVTAFFRWKAQPQPARKRCFWMCARSGAHPQLTLSLRKESRQENWSHSHESLPSWRCLVV